MATPSAPTPVSSSPRRPIFRRRRALDTGEIARIMADYRRAADNAKLAGFDGVEVDSANDYLLEQFVRDSTNLRTDRYGGTLENRLRFPLEVVRAVAEVGGASAFLFIANPDLIRRLHAGAPPAEAPKEYWYGGDTTGYSDWPAIAGR